MNRTELEKTFKAADAVAFERMFLKMGLDVSWIELTMMQREHVASVHDARTGLERFYFKMRPDPGTLRITNMTGSALRQASAGDRITQRHVSVARGLIYNGVLNLKRRALA